MKLLAQPQRVVVGEGISTTELEHMVVHSAPLTHEWANRRWMHWIFKINMATRVVERMAYRQVQGAQGGEVMYEECEDCEGDGCKACGWHGEIRRRVLV